MNSISAALTITLALAVSIISEEAMALEEPEYTVVFEQDDVEFRQYRSYLVAETLVQSSGDYNDAANEGFRRLFGYISGANNTQQKVAMTAPVQQAMVSEKIAMTAPVQQIANEDGWLVNFMLPGKFTLETAPLPDDTRIVVRVVPGSLMAVRGYSGRWTAANFDKHSQRLLADLEKVGISPTGQVTSAVYSPPFMPPFMRRNEVMVPVNGFPE